MPEKHLKSSSYAVFLIVLSSVLSSTGTIFYDEAIEFLSPILAVCSLHLAGGLVLLVILQSRKKLPSLSLIKKHSKGLVLLTVLRSIIGAFLLAHGLRYTDGIKIIFLTKIEPYFIIFWYWLLRGHGISPRILGLLAIHIIAAVTLSTNGELNVGPSQRGDLLVFLGIACFSLTYIQAKETSDELGALPVNALTSLVAGIFWLPYALYYAPEGVFSLSHNGWYCLALVIVLHQIIGMTIWFVTLGLMRGWMVSALRTLGPIAAAPFAWLFFGQSLSPLQIGAAAVVLTTSGLIAKEHLQEKV